MENSLSQQLKEKHPQHQGYMRDENSYWELEFKDNSVLNESESSFHSFGVITTVECQGGKKSVFLAELPITKITAHHGGYTASFDVNPDIGEKVYQYTSAFTTFLPRKQVTEIHNRTIGVVKDGVVIKEKSINGLLGTVNGFVI